MIKKRKEKILERKIEINKQNQWLGICMRRYKMICGVIVIDESPDRRRASKGKRKDIK